MVTVSSAAAFSSPPPTARVVTIPYGELAAFCEGEGGKGKGGGGDGEQTECAQERRLRHRLVELVGEAFGPDGLGILAVSDFPPEYVELRRNLLPLAAKIPHLPDLNDTCVKPESLYSVGWSHGQEFYEPGKPDLSKGSFYANPLTDDLVESLIERDVRDGDGDGARGREYWTAQGEKYPEFYAPNVFPDASLHQLRRAFVEIGRFAAGVGRMLAKLCDAYCLDCGGVELNLEKTLTRSLNANGRLLHYFAVDGDDGGDGDEQQQQQQASSAAADVDEKKTADDEEGQRKMWCGWHNDHGSLTALVPAMYLDRDGREVVEAEGGGDGGSGGLHIQSRSGEIVRVSIPKTALGFQIGETSQIQSGGVLRATPHAVVAAAGKRLGDGITRESFALFLEPEFDDILQIPPGRSLDDCQDAKAPLPSSVVPLKRRWKPGMSFGDFHRATVSAFTPNAAAAVAADEGADD